MPNVDNNFPVDLSLALTDVPIAPRGTSVYSVRRSPMKALIPMRNPFPLLLVLLILAPALPGAEPAKKPPLKIIPGKVIVPTDAMRRIWGELLTIDPKTRTGTFRNESTEEVMPFTILPYAELLHHAAFGDIQDFRTGERLIFRLHQNDDGKWVWLTYIQDEMNMLFNHKEYFHVDRLDPAKGEIEYTQGNADKTYVRAKELILETDENTRFWKNGEPAAFSDIHLGDKLRAKTHGIGQGKHHRAWEVFLDDASLQKFQKEQQLVHSKRLAQEGWPGYVDASGDNQVRLTLFLEGRDLGKELKAGQAIRVAPAGVDRKAGQPVEGILKDVRPSGNLNQVTIDLKTVSAEPMVVGGLARLWITAAPAANAISR